MSQSMMLLVNPVAGRSTSAAALGAVIETFCADGLAPTVYFTLGRGGATRIAAEHGAEYDRLVCMGGDGTLSETISGLMAIPPAQRPPLGYIAMGTTNDVAGTLQLPRGKPQAAARDILKGQQMPYDVGRFNGGRYFTYVAAFGAFTEVSYSTDQEVKKALGHAAYLLAGLTSLPKLKSYKVKVEYDGGTIEEEMIFGA